MGHVRSAVIEPARLFAGTGATSLLEKQIRHLNPSRLSLWVRPEMESFASKESSRI